MDTRESLIEEYANELYENQKAWALEGGVAFDIEYSKADTLKDATDFVDRCIKLGSIIASS